MAVDFPVPETRVLAVASHVVYGNVGNKIAVFVMQSLGCDVAAVNTVQFSNHTGYGQWTGSRVSADEISDLYQGLKQSHLDDMHMMLSGYIPGAAAVRAVGRIAKDLKSGGGRAPGSFFWVLDPVMGDNGQLYVAEDVVNVYKDLLPLADLVLPNQFEAELLTEIKITDLHTIGQAIQALHTKYNVPHVVVTSVDLPSTHNTTKDRQLSVVGSTRTSDGRARLFRIGFPVIDCYFCGTGDMFAALTVVRMREAVGRVAGLMGREAWLSDDDVSAEQLPLARAVEMVLGSMHQVLAATSAAMGAEPKADDGDDSGAGEDGEKSKRLASSKAAEIRLVRNIEYLRKPVLEFRAEPLE